MSLLFISAYTSESSAPRTSFDEFFSYQYPLSGSTSFVKHPTGAAEDKRQENPPEYYHSVRGDSDGLCRHAVLDYRLTAT